VTVGLILFLFGLYAVQHGAPGVACLAFLAILVVVLTGAFRMPRRW